LLLVNKNHAKILAGGRLVTVKKPDKFLRLVFDGREANTKLDKTRFPHLVLPRQLLIAQLCVSMTCMAALDLRNWFYQIPANSVIQQLSGVRTGLGIRMLAALPMGILCAPVLAHVTAMAIVLWRQQDESPLGAEVPTGDQVPECIWLREGERTVGCIIVYLDNIFVFTLASDLRDLWVKRIERNCKHLRCLIKGTIEKTSLVEDGAGVGVLGAEYRKKAGALEVRVAAAKMASWPKAISKSGRLACKGVARVVAIITHSLRIRRIAWSQYSPVLDIGRKAARVAASSAWTAPMELGEEEILALNTALAFVHENEWRAMSLVRPGMGVSKWATDATLQRWATVFVGGDHEVSPDDQRASGVIPDWIAKATAAKDIFARELYAVYKCVCKCPENAVCVIAIDNEAVVAVLTRMYAPAHIGQRLCGMVQEVLAEKRSIIVPFWIPTAHNVADVDTRPEHYASRPGEWKKRMTLTLGAFTQFGDVLDPLVQTFLHAGNENLPELDAPVEEAWKAVCCGLAARGVPLRVSPHVCPARVQNAVYRPYLYCTRPACVFCMSRLLVFRVVVSRGCA
jgi:hypothetical protein